MASNTATLQIRIQVDKTGSVEIVEKTFNNIRNVSKKAMTQAMKDQRDYWQAYDSFQKKLGANMAAEVERGLKAQKAGWDALGIRSKRAIEDEIALVKRFAAEKQAIYAKGSLEWDRLENAKNAKLKLLNNEMVGNHEMSMAAMMRAVLRFYAVWYVAQASLSGLKNFVMDGIQSIDEMKISSIAVAAQLTTMQGTTGNIVENYKKNVEYAKALIPVLQQVDAASLASFEQIQAMHMAMTMVQGPLNINSPDQVKAFTALTNVVSLYAQGADKMKQARQEIGAIFRGETKQSDLAAKALDEQIKRVGVYKDGLKGLVEEGRKHGDTLQRLKPYLIGIEAATGDISKTWEAVGSSIETAFGMIQRELFKDLYKDLIVGGQKAVEWTKANAAEIADAIKRVSKDIVFGLAAVGVASVNFSKIWKVMATDVVVSNSKMARSFGVFVSGIVGYEIGRFLYGEFETVRKAGVAMVYGLASSWDWLMEKMAKGWEYVKSIAKLAWNPDDAMQIIKQTKSNIKAIEEEYKAKKKFNDQFRDEQLKAVADQNFYKKQKQGDGVPYPDITGGVDLAALEAEEQARKQAADAAKAQAEKIADVIANLQWELSIVNLAEGEQAALNAVRSAGADLASKEGQQIYNLTKALQKQRDMIAYNREELARLAEEMAGSDYEGTEATDQWNNKLLKIWNDELYGPQKNEYKDWLDSLDDITKESLVNIHNSIAGFFSKTFRGELNDSKDVFKELMFTMSDSAAEQFAIQFEKIKWDDLLGVFGESTGKFFQDILDEFNISAGEAVTSLGAVIATAYSAVGMAKKDAALSGAMTGLMVGSKFGPVGAAVGGVAGGIGGYLLGDNGPSYGEQLAKAMDALAEKTDLNTEATEILTKEMLSGKDYSAGGLITKYFDPKLLAESVTGNKSLLESLALPMIKVLENGMLSIRADFTDKGNRNQELIYKAFDRAGLGDIVPRKIELGGDYGRRNANAAEINTLFTSLFDATSKEGISGLVRVVKALDSLTKTGDVTLLFDELAKLPEYADIGAANIRELFRAFETEYESGAKVGRNTKNATENMISEVWATIENEVTSSFLGLIPTLEGLGEQYNVALAGSFTDADGALQQLFNTAFSAKDKAVKSVDDTFENVKTEVDNLKALSASGLINLDPKIQAFLDSFDGAIATIKQGIEDFYATARAEVIADMTREMDIAVGAFSTMEQQFFSIDEAAQKYIDTLVDNGMALADATAQAKAYSDVLKQQWVIKQRDADIATYMTRIWQAQNDEATLLVESRKAEIEAIQETYGGNQSLVDSMTSLANATWEIEDAATEAAKDQEKAAEAQSKLTAILTNTLSLNEAMGKAFDPALFLKSIGLGGADLAYLFDTSDIQQDFDAMSRMLTDGAVTQEQYNAIVSILIDNARDLASTVQEATDAEKERLATLSATGRDSGAWRKGILEQYGMATLTDYQKAISDAMAAMQGFRQEIINAGGTVADGWKAGGYVEKEVTAAIKTSFMKSLTDAMADDYGQKSTYMQGIDEINEKHAEYIRQINGLIDVTENVNKVEELRKNIIKQNQDREEAIARATEFYGNDPVLAEVIAYYNDRYDAVIAEKNNEITALLEENNDWTELTAQATQAAAEASKQLNLELLSNVRNTLFDLTGDPDLLTQTITDLQKTFAGVASDDFGGQYDALQDILGVMTQLRDIQKSQLEETINSYKALDDVINELRGGSLAPVQSREFFERRYQQLLADAKTGDAGAISDLTGFVNQYADFMKSYGPTNYKDFTQQVIDDFEGIQWDISGGKTLDDLNAQLESLGTDYMQPVIDQLIRIGDILAGKTGSGSVTDALTGGVPGFASGGYHSGGLRIVGERGPELEFTGASRISGMNDMANTIANAVAKAINANGDQQLTVKIDAKFDGKGMDFKVTDVLRTNPDARKEVRHIMRAA